MYINTEIDTSDVFSNYNRMVQPQVAEYPAPEIDIDMYTGEYQNERAD